MYKLEDNVEWSNELKNAFKRGVTRAKVLYDNVELNENNYLQNFKFTEQRYIKNYGFVGTATARKLELNILDTNGVLNLENKEVTLKLGADYDGDTYYINYGNFIVDKSPEYDETNGTTRIVLYDYMVKFNKPYEDRVKYPCSLLVLLKDVCEQAGVELGSENFANKNFIVENNQFENATLRGVLQQIGKCAFSWARIGQDNKLYLDFSLSTETQENITINEYKLNSFKKAQNYYGPINQVTYADSDIEGQEERVKDQESIDENGLKELVIYDNIFAYTPEKRHELIQAGTMLLGLRYMPITQLDMIGFAYLDCSDGIAVDTLNGETFTSRVFTHEITYNGTLHDGIINEATSDNEDVYKNTANDIFQDMQTRAVIDKANKKIELVVEDVQNNSAIKSSKGNGQITLFNCRESYLVKLRIIGNNQVFRSLYISNRLKVSSSVYVRGDSVIVVTDKDGNSTEYDLGIHEVLRANDEVYDEYILENNHAKVIRRVNPDGTTRETELIEDLGTLEIYLKEGNNILKLQSYYANLEGLYIENNGYTDQLSTKEETKAEIEITKNEIDFEVSKKVNDEDLTGANIILRINGDESESEINADKVSLKGKEINLTSDNITIDSTNFSVDENGRIYAISGNIGGFELNSDNGFIANVQSQYTYDTNDYNRLLSIMRETITPTQEDYDKYDFTNDGEFKSNDLFILLNILNGRESGSGIFKIDHKDPKNCIQIKDDIEGLEASIGFFGANFSRIVCGNGGIYSNGSIIIKSKYHSNNATVIQESIDYGGQILLYDTNGDAIVTINNNSTGQITCVSLVQTSKESKKKNIEKYENNCLDVIKNSEIYTYNFKTETDEDKKHIGFVIGDEGGSYKTPKEVISNNSEGIDTYSMTSILWKAVQEQQEIIEQMQNEIKELKGGIKNG